MSYFDADDYDENPVNKITKRKDQLIEEDEDDDDYEEPVATMAGGSGDDGIEDEPAAEDDEEPQDQVQTDEQPEDGDEEDEGGPTQKVQTNAQTITIEEDDDDDNFVEYLKEFNQDETQKYVLQNHPETIKRNYHEILELAKVTRDGKGRISDPLHRTFPKLTKYEKAAVIGKRAKQINAGSPVFVRVPETVINGEIIAAKELEEKRIPFILGRPLPNGACEFWHLSDLAL